MRKEKNWFRRHLNWTLVLGWAAANGMAWLISSVPFLINPYTPEDTYYLIFYVVFLLLFLGLGGWFLKQKSRGLWNLLWIFFPWVGILIFISLENKSEEAQDV